MAIPQLQLLDNEQISQIHKATLDVLQKTGVKVQDAEARAVMVEAGAEEMGNEIVRIPPDKVEEAIGKAPSSIEIFTRDGDSMMTLTAKNTYYGTGGSAPYIQDHQSGQRRPFTIDDAKNLAIVADACENIHFNMTMCHSSDVPVSIRDVHEVIETLLTSPKPLIIAANDSAGLSDMIKMFAVIADGEQELADKPFVIFYTEPVSPLQHTKHSLGKLLMVVDAGLPVLNTPAPMAGATGPITLAGNIVIGNAELLSGLVLVQQRKPGAPFIYGGVFSTLDMASTVMPYASTELQLQTVAAAQMGRYYGLPTFGTAGCSDAHSYNQQAAFEAGQSILINALCGANLIHDVGWLEFANVTSLEAIVDCNEMIGWAGRFMRGIEISTETLATDLISQVGIGGSFIDTDLTMRRYRSEQWFPRLSARARYDQAQTTKGKSHKDKLQAEVSRIIREHVPVGMSEDKQKEVRRLMNESDSRRQQT